jgi:hypothetical protein
MLKSAYLSHAGEFGLFWFLLTISLFYKRIAHKSAPLYWRESLEMHIYMQREGGCQICVVCRGHYPISAGKQREQAMIGDRSVLRAIRLPNLREAYREAPSLSD